MNSQEFIKTSFQPFSCIGQYVSVFYLYTRYALHTTYKSLIRTSQKVREKKTSIT